MDTQSPDGLVLTGERTLPGIEHENYWFQRHVVAYRLAAPRVGGRVVLDAGCGEGYGLRLLARAGAARVIGADLDEPVVEHIRRTYTAEEPRIEAVACELGALPLGDDACDVTVSFQVIEHLYDIPAYLASLRRVTRPGGEVLIATPNRLTFTPDSETPVNPFHTREFSPGELRDELERAGLRVSLMLGVHHGTRIAAVETATRRRSFTDLLVERPPEDWPRWLRTLVGRVQPDWFDVRSDDLDASLDLVAICRVPRR